MQYEIKGGAFPVVICQLNDGEQMITEKGSMVWMSPNMEMKTSGGEHLHRPRRQRPHCLRLQLPRADPGAGDRARQ